MVGPEGIEPSSKD